MWATFERFFAGMFETVPFISSFVHYNGLFVQVSGKR
jgi:hypothetical protein